MPQRVKCSGCGSTFARRGFGSHNAAMHGGEATGEPVEEETGPEPVEVEETPAAETPTDDGGDLDLDGARERGAEAYREAFGDPETEVEGDPDAGQVADDVADTEEDAREYHCGGCGHPLDYLGGEDREGGGKACPECGERLYWSRVEA